MSSQPAVMVVTTDGAPVAPWTPQPKRADSGVYIFRGASGCPIYIGRSINLASRIRAHHSKAWWPEIASVEVVLIDDERDLWEAEFDLIQRHRPKYNVKLNKVGSQMPELQWKASLIHVTAACYAWKTWGRSDPALLDEGAERTSCRACINQLRFDSGVVTRLPDLLALAKAGAA